MIDTVKRGEMVREVRGLGTLVPEDIRWIPALTEARVERRVLLPGTIVKPDSVILELSNPELLRRRKTPSRRYAPPRRATPSSRCGCRASCSTRRPRPRASRPSRRQARLRADADAELHKNGLIADITLKLSQSAADELEHREKIEQQRLAIAGEAIEAQMRVQQADVDQARAQARLRRSQVEALHLRAGIDGVLQVVPVEVGQRVTPGTNLARVARPESSRPRSASPRRRPATWSRTESRVDTRNGIVEGTRDPRRPRGPERHRAGGHRTPRRAAEGPRPDLTVDGTIELERLW